MAVNKYIYSITNPFGKMYIGQTLYPEKRFGHYRRLEIPAQHKLRESIRKYGWNSHTTEIITSIPIDQADYAEKYLIAFYGTVNNGLNILAGGGVSLSGPQPKRTSSLKGRPISESHKIAISKSLIGNKRNLGRVRSDDEKKRISLTLKGRKKSIYTNSEKTRKFSLMKPVVMYDLKGNELMRFPSVQSGSEHGFIPSCIGRVCDGLRATHHKMIFKWQK